MYRIFSVWLVFYVRKVAPLVPVSVTQTQDDATALSSQFEWGDNNNNNLIINNEFQLQDRIDFLGYIKLFNSDDTVGSFIGVQQQQKQQRQENEDSNKINIMDDDYGEFQPIIGLANDRLKGYHLDMVITSHDDDDDDGETLNLLTTDSHLLEDTSSSSVGPIAILENDSKNRTTVERKEINSSAESVLVVGDFHVPFNSRYL